MKARLRLNSYTFRPLAIGAAAVAADITLTDLPAGHAVVNKADASRLHEAIELLLDAGQWRAADDLYSTSAGNGDIWLDLPAAALGQRAAMAFAAPGRRNECSIILSAERLGFYLNEAGLFAMMSGDMVTALEYLLESLRHCQDNVDPIRPQVLQNLTDCLGNLGRMEDAREAATKSLAEGMRRTNRQQIITAHAYLGWVAGLNGEILAADKHFRAADRLHFAYESRHLYSLAGVLWAEFLARTERNQASQTLAEENLTDCLYAGWTIDAALCKRVLGRLAIADGNLEKAFSLIDGAVSCFREGDYLVELATTLTDMAKVSLVSGDLDLANRLATEAISIAAPRRLVPIQSAALATRARLGSAQFAATGKKAYLARGRDAADAALRLSTVGTSLPWCELDALRAHLFLDRAEGVDGGWRLQADALYARLVPPDLDPDPLISARWGVTFDLLNPD